MNVEKIIYIIQEGIDTWDSSINFHEKKAKRK